MLAFRSAGSLSKQSLLRGENATADLQCRRRQKLLRSSRGRAVRGARDVKKDEVVEKYLADFGEDRLDQLHAKWDTEFEKYCELSDEEAAEEMNRYSLDFPAETREKRLYEAAKKLLPLDDEQVRCLAKEACDAVSSRDFEAEKLDEKNGTYAPLHVHSDFSLLDGASKIPALVARAEKFKSPGLALTDHGVMYGAVRLIQACQGTNIKPIIGNEMYLVNRQHNAEKPEKRTEKYHQIVLAKNDEGYRNLVKLTTESHLRGRTGAGWFQRPCINKLLLAHYKDSLIVTSACLGGEIPQAIMRGKPDVAEQVARWYQDTLGDDFYLELQDHGLKEDRQVNSGLVHISKKLGIKCIVTNDSHFTGCDDFKPHDALICINTNARIDAVKRIRYSGLEYFRPYSEMINMFEDHLEREDVRLALKHTLEVSDKIEEYNILGLPQIPDFPLPEEFTNHKEYLAYVSNEGLQTRFPRQDIPEEYQKRLNYELDMMDDMGFNNYFLVVWDYIREAREQGIPVGPGRGSAAGCLVAFALRITAIDPIHHGLLFERFLNPERKSMPDIDTDFSVEGRDKVIKYVTEKYGEDRVAQIITFNRLTSRAVLRDVGRVTSVPLSNVDKLSKLIPVIRGKPASLDTLISDETPSREFKEDYETHGETADLVDTALTIEGLNKSHGIHAAGVVISAGPLSDLVPLSRGKRGEVVTQYSMEDVESLGLLKMDFLGLKTLSVIEETIALVNKEIREEHERKNFTRKELSIEVEDLDLTDRKTYDLLGSGDLDGIFQLDASGGMQQIVRELRPNSIEDISSILALYRPGPLDAGLIPKFIARKHGREKIEYDHPKLEPILRETYGVLVYQEQIMRTARELAGYSLGQADILRRAMGKKKKDVMEQETSRFVDGAVKNGVDTEIAKNLFDQMVKFAEYCFNKSHSTAYAMVTFQTAYLKANYPLEFLTALLKANAQNPDKLQRYISDAVAMGVPVLPPCINKSELGFSPITDVEYIRKSKRVTTGTTLSGAILFGLDAIKGVGESSAEVIVEEREKNGEYRNLVDLVERHESRLISKRALEPLIEAGALDALHMNRRVMMDTLPKILDAKQKLAQRYKRMEKKGTPREEMTPGEKNEQKQEECMLCLQDTDTADYDIMHCLQAEKRLLGFYASGHPLRFVHQAAILSRPDRLVEVSGKGEPAITEESESDAGHGSSESLDAEKVEIPVVAKLEEGAQVMCFGMIKSIKMLATKAKGEKMAKVVLEDPGGTADCILFPRLYKRVAAVVEAEQFVCVWGTVSHNNGFSQIVAEEFRSLREMDILCVSLAGQSEIDESRLRELRSILVKEGELDLSSLPTHSKYPVRRSLQGRTPVVIADFEGMNYRLATKFYVKGKENVVNKLKEANFNAMLIPAFNQAAFDEEIGAKRELELVGTASSQGRRTEPPTELNIQRSNEKDRDGGLPWKV